MGIIARKELSKLWNIPLTWHKWLDIIKVMICGDGCKCITKGTNHCCNPNLGLTTKARGCKVAGQKGDPRVPGQKTIWMWPPWKGAKYIIKWKVVAFPKSWPW